MHALSLHNSLSRRKERFEPLDHQHVRMYVCGPTVYDLAHIGNARTMVVFDVLSRVLRVLYPRVTYVRNITDVDDKINARAKESGEPIASITARTTADFHADMANLGVLPPDEEPRATQHIGQMIEIIQRLIDAGHAYAAEGHVLFSVPSFKAYGHLSGHAPDELLAGARIDVAPYKRDAGDFVLWKPSSPDIPGWDSPWGRGRPGWHIECSAMSWRYLGETFDIHGGGTDLIFPHHENELAQSVCAFPGSHFARYWVHSGMLQINDEKMSKSLGNFFTIREVLAKAPAEAIRLALIRTHYHSVADFSEAALAEARRELDRFYRALERYPDIAAVDVPPSVMEALCDDLNTPLALSAMHALADRALAGDFDAACGLRAAGAVLGIVAAGCGRVVPRWRCRCRGDRGGDCRAAGGAQGTRVCPCRRDPRRMGGEGHCVRGRAARHDLAACGLRGIEALGDTPSPTLPRCAGEGDWQQGLPLPRSGGGLGRGYRPMTGREGGADIAPIGNSPVVVLVRPQLADNIGACARAMANGGLFHLRLVAPRDGWPQEKAWRNASGADRILDAVTLFASVPDADRRSAPRLRNVSASAPHHKAGAHRARRRGRTARDLSSRSACRHSVRTRARRPRQR